MQNDKFARIKQKQAMNFGGATEAEIIRALSECQRTLDEILQKVETIPLPLKAKAKVGSGNAYRLLLRYMKHKELQNG
ncbi:MAG: hypothetical protein K2W95_01030 [Candidatus Obscuribacterales bacterium]|nr:hypothetical protein [Candidatus Obscuribacterales bacterium]